MGCMIFCRRFGVLYDGAIIEAKHVDVCGYIRNIEVQLFSDVQNVVVSSADAIAMIWNIVYYQNTSKNSKETTQTK